MSKSGKSRGRQNAKARQNKPGLAKKQASSGINVEEKVKKSAAAVAPKTVQVTETPEARSFDIKAYFMSWSWIYPVALILLMALMLYLRVGPSHDAVFTNWEGNYVNFASDDAVYHMRLVHYTVDHFPQRLFYDAFTHYPYGSMVHFGPLFTLTIAGASLIIGLGHPSPALVDAVGAYTPAVMGMLCAIPTYFIGRKLFGRNAGIIAAVTLALLPGQFMSRSMLGFTDHHIAEVLFSIATVGLMIYALEAAKTGGLSLSRIRSKDRDSLASLGYAALAGVSFGLYLLSWPGGLIVAMVIFLYFMIQIIVDHTRSRDPEYMLLLAIPVFTIPALMVLPYSITDLRFELLYYSITQPFFLILALAGIGFAYGLSRALKKTAAETWTFPVALTGIGVAGLLVLFVAAPQIFALIMAGLKVFSPDGGMTVVGEAISPIFDQTGAINYTLINQRLWQPFFWTLPISMIAIAMLCFRVIKYNRPAEWLFLVWNLIMLLATFSQTRFSYYFAVNAALLTGYLTVAVFHALDWNKFADSWHRKVRNAEDARRFISGNQGQILTFAAVAILFAVMIAWPATGFSTVTYNEVLQNPGKYLLHGHTEITSTGSSGVSYEWYQTLLWMRNNTPDPQGSPVSASLDFNNSLYQKPADDTPYPYPASAYGVMSWWDYGHIITYIAHRIPNANPFQAGVSDDNNTRGAAPFFLSTTEDKGYANLQALGSRYVVMDFNDANSFIGAMSVWANDQEGWDTLRKYRLEDQTIQLPVNSQKYYDCMANRLYYQDCANMSHFRLVYESPGNYFVHLRWVDLSAQRLLTEEETPTTSWANYTEAYNSYALAVNPIGANPDQPTLLVYDAQPPEKRVKVFEVVKGATITGKAAPGSNVSATLELKTGDRTFQYTQHTAADLDGRYNMTVSYPTEAMNGTGYSSPVIPAGKYNLTVGNTTTTQIDVPERAIQNGEAIVVS
ncbi:MAG TPA: oligosaccharyl transferase, archaeosortase A system-associated [Methanocella sp.]|nr:oligosaccharyl transferase, archaeosortase A system-associated [Methanocella sp.]